MTLFRSKNKIVKLVDKVSKINGLLILVSSLYKNIKLSMAEVECLLSFSTLTTLSRYSLV